MASRVLALDVVHSFKTLMSKEAAPQFKTIYAEVKDVVVVSERVVRFDFATPNPELPLVVGGMAVFSRDWGMAGGKRKPPGPDCLGAADWLRPLQTGIAGHGP